MTTAFVFLITILVLPYYSVKLFTTPRNSLLALSLPVCLAAWSGDIYTDPFILSLSGALLLVWVASTVFATRPDIAFPPMYRHAAAMFLGLVAVPAAGPEHALIALVAGGCVQALVSFIQRAFHAHLDKTAKTFAGLTGNTNVLGPHLVLAFFIALHISNTITYFPAAILFIGVIVSRCRGSIGGMAAGLAAFHWALALPAIAAAHFSGRLSLSGLSLRSGIWRYVYRALTWKIWSIGCGHENSKLIFQKMYPVIDKTRIRFRRAHNDVLQWVLDAGVISAGLQLTILIVSVVGALYSGAPFLAGALIAIFINGLVFHTSHFAVVSVPYWVIIGYISARAGVSLQISPWIIGWGAATLFVLWTATWGRNLLSDVMFRWCGRRPREQQKRLIPIISKINPVSSYIGLAANGILVNGSDKGLAFYKTAVAIDRDDGEFSLAAAWFFHGVSAWNLGQRRLAHAALLQGLSFDPKDQNILAMLKQISGGPGASPKPNP